MAAPETAINSSEMDEMTWPGCWAVEGLALWAQISAQISLGGTTAQAQLMLPGSRVELFL